MSERQQGSGRIEVKKGETLAKALERHQDERQHCRDCNSTIVVSPDGTQHKGCPGLATPEGGVRCFCGLPIYVAQNGTWACSDPHCEYAHPKVDRCQPEVEAVEDVILAQDLLLVAYRLGSRQRAEKALVRLVDARKALAALDRKEHHG